jgi:hypothetical protein
MRVQPQENLLNMELFHILLNGTNAGPASINVADQDYADGPEAIRIIPNLS